MTTVNLTQSQIETIIRLMEPKLKLASGATAMSPEQKELVDIIFILSGIPQGYVSELEGQ